MSVAERAIEASSAEQANESERCERTSKQTSEWPSTYVPIIGLSEPPCNGAASLLCIPVQRVQHKTIWNAIISDEG